MSKAYKTGGEIDSYCTKCKIILNHRIIAMLGPKPVKVECSTCSSHHMYRPKLPGTKTAGTGTTRTAKERPETRAQVSERERVQNWEKAIAGKSVRDFRAYRVTEKFNEGDLVRHSKFGDGKVSRVIDANKVEVLFKDDTKMLAHGM
jgi:hypothetical protein